MQTMQVVVPQGVFAGQTIQVQGPSGLVNVQVPQGVIAGDTMSVQVPGAAALPMTMCAVPPGAPPGGQWIPDQYCGILTILIAIFLVPCVCCCPCDTRQVYLAPTGTKYLPDGRVAGLF